MSLPAISPVSSAGGASVETAIRSVSNLRTIRKEIGSQPFAPNSPFRFRVPNVGYVKSHRVEVKVPVTVALGTGTAALRDIRKIVQRIAFSLQGTTEPRSLDGISENEINKLDYRVRNPIVRFRRRDTGADAGVGAALASTTYDLTFHLKPLYTMSENNLYSLLYVGGGSTAPSVEIDTGDIADFITLGGGATATFGAGTVYLRMECITAERPIPPGVDG